MDWKKLFLHQPDEPLLFHTGFFLLIFSVFLILYTFLYQKRSLRDVAIILFGLYFYYKSSGAFVGLLVLCLSADYFFAKGIGYFKDKFVRKLLLTLGIIFSLSFLFYFKYKNFFLENLAAISGEDYILTTVILPIGISFYTFQSISYMVDVYKNNIEPSGYIRYMMYMTFFPHLVAGPIVRAKDFLPQTDTTVSLSKANLNEAMFLIFKGFVKKAIIADYVGQYSDIVFSNPKGFSGAEHLVASLSYALQIFCDFSGYTDMAIGIALLLGFRLCMNFDSPYKSINITDFWRRWHISLSSWLRDYIYIPFGGNKKGFRLQLLFLFLTMLIGGFWHGASWKFVFWGAGHGVLLIIHKVVMKKFPKAISNVFYKISSWILTFACVALLWIPFRAQTMADAGLIYSKIFSNININYFPVIYSTNPLLIFMLLFGFVATLLPSKFKFWIRQQFYGSSLLMKFIMLAVIIQMFLQVKSSYVQPFIYFQF